MNNFVILTNNIADIPIKLGIIPRSKISMIIIRKRTSIKKNQFIYVINVQVWHINLYLEHFIKCPLWNYIINTYVLMERLRNSSHFFGLSNLWVQRKCLKLVKNTVKKMHEVSFHQKRIEWFHFSTVQIRNKCYWLRI